MSAAEAVVSPPAFEALAADYDRTFTTSTIGTAMRRAVWRHLDHCFAAGDRVLELGCGTGEDALHLAQRGVSIVAVDAAPAMVEATHRKAAAAGLATHIEARTLTIEHLHTLPATGRTDAYFDGAFSNFGALNCVAALPPVAAALAARLRPEARLLLCVMGPLVPWEWLWYLRHGKFDKAFRRLRRQGVPWRGLTVRYPSPATVRRAFAPAFRPRRTVAIGALLPPTYAEPWAARHPRLLARLGRWERRLEGVPPLPWLADHYLLELERR